MPNLTIRSHQLDNLSRQQTTFNHCTKRSLRSWPYVISWLVCYICSVETVTYSPSSFSHWTKRSKRTWKLAQAIEAVLRDACDRSRPKIQSLSSKEIRPLRITQRSSCHDNGQTDRTKMLLLYMIGSVDACWRSAWKTLVNSSRTVATMPPHLSSSILKIIINDINILSINKRLWSCWR